VKNVELRRLPQKSKKEKQRLQHQLRGKKEPLEKLQHNKLEVKRDFSISCCFHDDDFVAFGKQTSRIG